MLGLQMLIIRGRLVGEVWSTGVRSSASTFGSVDLPDWPTPDSVLLLFGH